MLVVGGVRVGGKETFGRGLVSHCVESEVFIVDRLVSRTCLVERTCSMLNAILAIEYFIWLFLQVLFVYIH